MAEKPKIAVFTGGGDCPGLNNAIKRIVHGAAGHFDIDGIVQGWQGSISMALNPDAETIETFTIPLDVEQVRRIDRQGGTMLMSSRANPYNHDGKDVSDEVLNFLNSRYHAVVAIGGEDTLGAAGKLAKKGLRVVGIPKTIDKDLCGTEYTLGFDSAVNRVTDYVKIMKSTAGSHGMTYFIEVMGRKAGHLTYWGGKAANVHFMTIPEVETDHQRLFSIIQERKKSMPIRRGFTGDGRRYTIVLVSEGTELKGVGSIKKGKVDSHGNMILGGVADYLCAEYIRETKDEDARSPTIGHYQRSGDPSNKDGIMAEMFANRALKLIGSEMFGRIVTAEGAAVGDTPLDVVIGRIRVLDVPKCYNTGTFQPKPLEDQLYHEVEVSK